MKPTLTLNLEQFSWELSYSLAFCYLLPTDRTKPQKGRNWSTMCTFLSSKPSWLPSIPDSKEEGGFETQFGGHFICNVPEATWSAAWLISLFGWWNSSSHTIIFESDSIVNWLSGREKGDRVPFEELWALAVRRHDWWQWNHFESWPVRQATLKSDWIPSCWFSDKSVEGGVCSEFEIEEGLLLVETVKLVALQTWG